MVDFSRLSRMVNKTCTQCGEEFLGIPENDDLCHECLFYREHPEEAPGYWTWMSSATGWKIQAKWRRREEHPEPGTVVTVHRKNGTTSQETIAEVERTYVDRAANRVPVCRVESA